MRGLQMVVDLLEAHGRADRRTLEFAVLVAVTSLMAYTVGRSAFLPALGHAPSAERDEDFRARLGDMLWAYVNYSDQ